MARTSSGHDLDAFYRRYIDVCNANEFDRLAEFVASDVQVNGEVQCLPGYVRGLEAVMEDFPTTAGTCGTSQSTVTGWPRTLSTPATSLDVLATGRRVTTQESALHRVAGGRIVEVWVTADNLRLVNQLR